MKMVTISREVAKRCEVLDSMLRLRDGEPHICVSTENFEMVDGGLRSLDVEDFPIIVGDEVDSQIKPD